MTELDDRLREHFRSISLTPEALARLHANAGGANRGATPRAEHDGPGARARIADGRERTTDTPGTFGRWSRRLLGLAPAGRLDTDRIRITVPRVAFASLLVGALGIAMYLNGSHGERTERTLREVAMNHSTQLTFEFEEDSLAALDRRMQMLPFEMTAPGRLPENARVLGSRYCSLAGKLAAHVKLRDAETGEPISLFVTSVEPELERLHGDRSRVDGIEVELFRENDLFYALARREG